MRAMRWLGRGLRRARSPFIRGAAILGYHRVDNGERDPFRLAVAPQHFAEQLEVLSRIALPVSLKELAQAVWDRTALHGKVAVTFDDGYADNLHTAKPMLTRSGIPATVYVVAGRMGRHLWWDELAAHLPDRRRLLRAHRQLLRVPHDLRRRMIEQIPVASGNGGAKQVPRVLTAGELVELAQEELISIGAHSVTHPLLTSLGSEEQRREIHRSKQQLEDLLGRSVETFAYPWGAASEETERLVCEAGFLWASGGFIDVVSRGSNPYDLPRLWVPDVDGDRFAKWLGGWLGA